MNILILAQHYHPEVTAAVNRLSALTESLVRHGHTVSVIAPKPNHPAGVILERYRGPLVKTESVCGAEVHYTWAYTSAKKSVWRRVLYYVSFTIISMWVALLLKGPYDVVFASSPPPSVGVAGWLIARMKRARFVLDVRDLWPGLAIALGELKNPIAIGAARAMESLCYYTADLIIAVTRPFQDEIRRRTRPNVPVELVPNGALPIFLNTPPPGKEGASAASKFVVSYVGNVGLCQGLAHIIEAADILSEVAPDVTFVVQGHGVVKDELVRDAAARRLRNVHFEDAVPTEMAVQTMVCSDALLVPLARVPMASQFVPSKLFDCMAVGKPVLLSVDGEARRILQDAEAGIYYPAEDGVALANAVIDLRSNLEAAKQMGGRGREYVRQRYRREQLSDRVVELMADIVGRT